MKVALTGAVQLELLERYFREAGHEIAAPGEMPDIVYDVTSREQQLKDEVDGFYDARLQALAGCPYSLAGIRAIVEEFGFFLAARELKTPKKILAVDADDTLWDGILSEDGRDALKPRVEFQRGLKRLAAEGVVLVLLSKNDPPRDGAFMRADMPLSDSDFAAMGVNWEPKAGNLIEICNRLSLSTDSVVFVDDNPHECAQMKAHLPEVSVVRAEGRSVLRRLREYFFRDIGLTAEDRLRAADYRNRERRQAAAKKFADKDEYLKSLDLHVVARPAVAADLSRLAQMAGKTNQFNATTLRRSWEDFAAMLTPDSPRQVFVFSAGDRFGEMGIVLYLVYDRNLRRVADFVMSCRAMGRTLEHFAYEWLARRVGCRPEVDFVPTAKNAPFAAFLQEVKAVGKLKTHFCGV